MKVITVIAFCFISSILLAQIQVRIGDSVILARNEVVDPSAGYGNCGVPYWSCTSPDIGVQQNTQYEYGIYIKPTLLHSGFRYDTCNVRFVCLDSPPPSADLFYANYTHTFIIEIKDSVLEVIDEKPNVPRLSIIGLLHPVILLSTFTHDRVRLDVVDILGKTLSVLTDELLAPGNYLYELDNPSGLYFISLQSPTHRITLKVFVQ
jgi:hypothetical protein